MAINVAFSPYRYSMPRRERRRFLGGLQKVKEAVLRFEVGPYSLMVFLMVAVVALMIIYLATYNKIATKGYDLKRLEADHQQLMNQYDIKNMKLATVKSLNNMISMERISGMRKPGVTEFVHGGDVVVAAK